jgi:hypothetical protein
MLDNMVLLTYHLLPLGPILGGDVPPLPPDPHLQVLFSLELMDAALRTTDTERMYM